MAIKEAEKAEKEASAKAAEARAEAKKRRIDEYVDSTYNQPTDNAVDLTIADEAILTPKDKAVEATNSNKTKTHKHKNNEELPKAKRRKSSSTSTSDSSKPANRKSKTKGPHESEPDHGPDNHFHAFPSSGHRFNEEEKKWYKTCPCGFTVSFEKM